MGTLGLLVGGVLLLLVLVRVLVSLDSPSPGILRSLSDSPSLISRLTFSFLGLQYSIVLIYVAIRMYARYWRGAWQTHTSCVQHPRRWCVTLCCSRSGRMCRAPMKQLQHEHENWEDESAAVGHSWASGDNSAPRIVGQETSNSGTLNSQPTSYASRPSRSANTNSTAGKIVVDSSSDLLVSSKHTDASPAALATVSAAPPIPPLLEVQRSLPTCTPAGQQLQGKRPETQEVPPGKPTTEESTLGGSIFAFIRGDMPPVRAGAADASRLIAELLALGGLVGGVLSFVAAMWPFLHQRSLKQFCDKCCWPWDELRTAMRHCLGWCHCGC